MAETSCRISLSHPSIALAHSVSLLCSTRFLLSRFVLRLPQGCENFQVHVAALDTQFRDKATGRIACALHGHHCRTNECPCLIGIGRPHVSCVCSTSTNGARWYRNTGSRFASLPVILLLSPSIDKRSNALIGVERSTNLCTLYCTTVRRL